MKVLKKIILTLFVIIAILLITALFLPKEFKVTVKQNIKKPKTDVMNYVKLLKNQEKYLVWFLKDPNLKPDYTGTDGTVGAKVKWDSKIEDVGAGEQEIISISDSRIDVDMHFIKPMEDKAKAATILNAISENETEIISEFYGKSKWPFNIMNFYAINYISETEQQSLHNLKQILEK